MTKKEILNEYIMIFDSLGLKEKYKEKNIANFALLIDLYYDTNKWNEFEKKLDKNLEDTNDFCLTLMIELKNIMKELSINSNEQSVINLLINQYSQFYSNKKLLTFGIIPIQYCPEWYKEIIKKEA